MERPSRTGVPLPRPSRGRVGRSERARERDAPVRLLLEEHRRRVQVDRHAQRARAQPRHVHEDAGPPHREDEVAVGVVDLQAAQLDPAAGEHRHPRELEPPGDGVVEDLHHAGGDEGAGEGDRGEQREEREGDAGGRGGSERRPAGDRRGAPH